VGGGAAHCHSFISSLSAYLLTTLISHNKFAHLSSTPPMTAVTLTQ
jgi:hypothetical protein